MADLDVKKLEDLLKKTIRPVKELVEVLKSKVDRQELYLAGTSSNVKSIKEQQSVVNEKLDDQNKKLDAQGEKLENLWDQVVRVTVDMTEIKETQGLHTVALKRIESKVENNSEDIKKLDKRLTGVENNAGIVPPPELTVN